MPNPLSAIDTFLDELHQTGELLEDATFGSKVPASSITVHHVQYAWDGTPADADNREDTVIRITAWGPKGKPTDTQDLAGEIRARLLDWDGGATVWRVDRGIGRLPGTDPATGLPFCSFTVQFVMRQPDPA